jgi:hypothetical protein
MKSRNSNFLDMGSQLDMTPTSFITAALCMSNCGVLLKLSSNNAEITLASANEYKKGYCLTSFAVGLKAPPVCTGEYLARNVALPL